jgi:hypothetical protein
MATFSDAGLWADSAAARTRDADPVAPRWFAALYTLAVAAHVVGNPPGAPGLRFVVTMALVTGSVVLVLGRGGRVVWAVVAVLQLLTAWLQAPALGNHWLVMGVFSLAVLVALPRPDPWAWLAPTLRVAFLVFYAFAAVAKLNTAFLDPTASCAVFYTDQALRSWGLAGLGGDGALAMVPIWSTLAVELSVPVLLLVTRTRGVGVALAALFHLAISLDLLQHFYDFTTVVLLGLAVFAGRPATERIGAWVAGRSRAVLVAVGAWTLLTVLALLPSIPAAIVATRLGAFVVWLPVGGAVTWLLVRAAAAPARVRLRPVGPAAVALLALVVLNGVLPYVGVKTANGFTMYANLATVEGGANHLLVPQLPALRDVEYVRITATDAAGLQDYQGSRWLVPEPNLLDHLAANPDATASYVRGDGTVVSGTGAQLGRPLPELVRRLAALRSIDGSAPVSCQALWLPAL